MPHLTSTDFGAAYRFLICEKQWNERAVPKINNVIFLQLFAFCGGEIVYITDFLKFLDFYYLVLKFQKCYDIIYWVRKR